MALLHLDERLVCALQAVDRVVQIRAQRGGHQQNAVPERTLLLLRAHRDRNLDDQRLLGKVVVLDEPATHGPGASRHHTVVHRTAEGVLDFLDLLERELREGKTAMFGVRSRSAPRISAPETPSITAWWILVITPSLPRGRP